MATARRILRYCTDTVQRCHWFVALAMLLVMLGLGLGSMAGDGPIYDEIAHIPAGYTNLHYGDYRFNPEHPPLIKVLAAIPLQFMDLQFPVNQPPWTGEDNAQWEAGWSFLYYLGNNPGHILFWARLPVLLLAVGFGVWLYRFLLRRYGKAVGLLGLFFYAFSPNILAHARFVTTDIGSSIFIFAALVAAANFMDLPDRRRTVLLSLGLALASLAKFNALVLYPFLLVFITLGALARETPQTAPARLKLYLGRFVGASLLSVAWIWLFYLPFTWNMPVSVQQRIIAADIPNLPHTAHALTALSGVPGLEPLVQFALGIAMVYSRVQGGNVTYFFGQVTDQSFRWYFPVLFVLKTQVAFLIFMVVVAAARAWVSLRQHGRRLTHHILGVWLDRHWLEVVLGVFAGFYMLVAVYGNLDIGLRHILPIYLPLFVLVAEGLLWLWRAYLVRWSGRGLAAAAAAGLLIWYGAATVWVYPSFLAYFNEFIGGPANAYNYFSDSNVDWGQDIVRFKSYLDNHPEIHQIAFDYFGGAIEQYYFCPRRYNPDGSLVTDYSGFDCSRSRVLMWHSQNGQYHGQYIAVSETYLEDDRFFSGQNGGYAYLRARRPIAEIGYSIYVYRLY